MSYRDQLDAAQARIAQLEEELAAAQGRIGELKKEKKLAAKAKSDRRKRKQMKTREAKRPVRLGKVYFDRLPTYFPVMQVYTQGVASAFREPVKVATPTSDSALLHLLTPVANLIILPFYYLLLTLVFVPAGAILSVLGNIVLIPFLFLSAFKLDRGGKKSEAASWLSGSITDESARMFLFIGPITAWPVVIGVGAVFVSAIKSCLLGEG